MPDPHPRGEGAAAETRRRRQGTPGSMRALELGRCGGGCRGGLRGGRACCVSTHGCLLTTGTSLTLMSSR